MDDIIGFGYEGVIISLSNDDGTFSQTQLVLEEFGYSQGWLVEKHPRFVVDINGDGKADIVGFGPSKVITSLSMPDGTFGSVQDASTSFACNTGWKIEYHPRIMADINADGRMDIVGFANGGTLVALANGDGTFDKSLLTLTNFGKNQGWSVDNHIRVMSDINGDGRADIVAFGDKGVYTALAKQTDGYFHTPSLVLTKYGNKAGGWKMDRHPRVMADVNGDGMDDIIGFANAGTAMALSNGDGTFSNLGLVVESFGYNQEWRVGKHIRIAADVNNDGKADIIGFGAEGVFLVHGNATGSPVNFNPAKMLLDSLGCKGEDGCDTDDLRFLSDVTNNGKLDIIAFESDGVYTAIAE